MSVNLSVCILEIDLKNFTVSLIKITVCTAFCIFGPVRDSKHVFEFFTTALNNNQQIELSVETGRQWLEEIKQYNFDEERRVSLEEQQAARDLREKVREFSDPVKKFQEKVSDVQKDIGDVDNRLQDLEDNLEKTEGMIRTASSLNFRNSGTKFNKKSLISDLYCGF